MASSVGMTDDEKAQFRPHGKSYLGLFTPKRSNIPDAHDWRDLGAVTPVQQQGSCGSCWAFSAVAAVEGLNAIRTGQQVKLSEQELLDCMYGTGLEGCCYGCSGGLMDPAFDFIVENGGLDTAEDYQYWGMWSWGCNTLKLDGRKVVSITGYQDIPSDETSLKAAVHQQPVAVAVCASTMQFYYYGVMNTCCEGLNHGVVAVGYGTDAGSGKDYWVVKNSWGSSWGQEGYIYIERNTGGEGMCGIASVASIPIKRSPNPDPSELPDFCYNPIGLSWKECYQPETCCCKLSFFGFFCLWSGCCEDAAADVATAAALPVT